MSETDRKRLRQVFLDLSPAWREESALFRQRLQTEGIPCEQAAQKLPGEVRTDAVLLTDDPSSARKAAACGLPCFGCSKKQVWFENVILVFESLEGIDGRYLEEWMLRALGRPVPIACTGRLEIREIAGEDFQDLIRIYRQQSPADRAGEETFTEEGLDAYIRTAYRLQGYGLWSVLYRGNVIGCCGFAPGGGAFDDPEEAGPVALELQYMVDEAFQRQGFATEMCLAAISYARERLGAEKILARIMPGNEASSHLAEKLHLFVL